jgi:hypothetical protein
LRVVGLDERRAVGEENDGQATVGNVEALEQADGFVVVLRIEPDVGNAIAGEEITDLVIAERPAGSDDADALEGRLVGRGALRGDPTVW